MINFHHVCASSNNILNHLLEDDLTFSDTNYEENSLKAQEQTFFINHGNGAVSSMRQTIMTPSSSADPKIRSNYNPDFHLINKQNNDFNFENDFQAISFLYPFGDIQRINSKQVDPLTSRKPYESIHSSNSENQNLNRPSLPSSGPHLPQDKNFPPLNFQNKMEQPLTNRLNQNFSPNFNPNFNLNLNPNRQGNHNYNPLNINPFQYFPIDAFIQPNPISNQFIRQPDYVPFFDSPYQMPRPMAPINRMGYNQPIEANAFQRRRLTINNNIQDNSLGLGYPSYNYYKGDQDAGTKWPKIFKFTDGRINLNDFERDKKFGKIKFPNDNYYDEIRRDSFLILHGGAYNY